MNDNLQTVVDLLGAHCKRLESEIERLTKENEMLRVKCANKAVANPYTPSTTSWPNPVTDTYGPTRAMGPCPSIPYDTENDERMAKFANLALIDNEFLKYQGY